MEETKKMIKKRLAIAKETMENWWITIDEYNAFVKHCRKLLNLLEKKDENTKGNWHSNNRKGYAY